MAAYLILFWVSFILAGISFLLSKASKKQGYENFSVFLTVLMVFFFILALATKDPIEGLLTTIPAFWQFVLTALGGTFAIWRFYLNPLKERVIRLERKVAVLDEGIKSGFALVKEEFSHIKDDLRWIKEDTRWVKEKLLK